MSATSEHRTGIPIVKSLLFKQTFAMVLILGLSVWGAAYLSARRESGRQLRDVSQIAEVTARQVAAGFKALIKDGRTVDIKHLGRAFNANPNVAYIGVYDAAGTCLWHSSKPEASTPMDISIFENSRKPIIAPRRIVGMDVVQVIHPMTERVGTEKKLLGAVVIGHTYRIAAARTKNAAFALLVTAACVFVAGGLTAYLTAKGLYGPIRRLTEHVQEITNGNLNARVTGVMPNDELGLLAKDFNTMIDKLADARRQIEQYNATLEKKIDETRRELETTRDQLVQHEKLASIGRLAAGVAHEINNPLTNILGYAQLIEEDLPADGGPAEDLRTVQREALRCKRIVEDLLMFARRPRPETKSCDMASIVDETIGLIKKQPLFDRVNFKRSYSGQTVCEIDPDQFKQVLTSLFVNAGEAMPEGGTVSVSLARNNGRLAISVTDTGCGIPEENRKKIFDPFFTTKDSGTGLGLSVLHGIVEQHGGRVDVTSEPGVGSVFTIEVPASEGSKKNA